MWVVSQQSCLKRRRNRGRSTNVHFSCSEMFHAVIAGKVPAMYLCGVGELWLGNRMSFKVSKR